ncbi:hypothetical protein HPG69_000970, partial [Diceros bicornis minor]
KESTENSPGYWQLELWNCSIKYPGSHGSMSQDKHLFTVLVQEMPEAFEQEAKQINKPRLKVTAAVAAGISHIQSGYEIPQLYLDYIHVTTYDLHSSWEGYSGENSPLYKHPTGTDWQQCLPQCEVCQWCSKIHCKYFVQQAISWVGCLANLLPLQDYAMNYGKDNGAPAGKLIIEFPAYGHTFILSNSSNTAICASTSDAGPAGPYIRQSGF